VSRRCDNQVTPITSSPKIRRNLTSGDQADWKPEAQAPEVFDYEQSLAIMDAALPFASLRAALTCFGIARFPDF
jgi:hypothetical protein